MLNLIISKKKNTGQEINSSKGTQSTIESKEKSKDPLTAKDAIDKFNGIINNLFSDVEKNKSLTDDNNTKNAVLKTIITKIKNRINELKKDITPPPPGKRDLTTTLRNAMTGRRSSIAGEEDDDDDDDDDDNEWDD